MSPTDSTDLSEFEPHSSREPVALRPYDSRVPEPMNNYNLPSDRQIIEDKLRLLREHFPTFANKSADDLEDLLRYEDLFQAHIDGLEQVQLTRTLEYELRVENESLAEINLTAEPELKKMRDKVAELQAVAGSLTTRLYELVQEHVDLQKPYSPQTLIQRMNDEANQLDIKSNEVLDNFRDHSGTIGLAECDDFIKQYKQLRKSYHSLDARHQLAAAAHRSGKLVGVPTMDR
ncbi:hypothetical protein EC988_001434 [Linderina pennispora]|nr:hypothetical protein EC988_001434 [Linderina pennispora]